MKKLIVDGKEYCSHEHKIEDELEKFVIENFKGIFGEDAIWIDKQKLKSFAGIGSIPDGFVINARNRKFYVVEIELAKHNIYDHVFPQVSKFINGVANHETRERLTKGIYEEIKGEPEIKNVIENEIYKVVSEMIKEYEVIVIIDENTEQVKEACKHLSSDLSNKTKILEFKTYSRKDAQSIHAFLFDSFLEPPKEDTKTEDKVAEANTDKTEKKIEQKGVESNKKERVLLEQIIPVIKDVREGIDYTEACKKIAKKLGHTNNTTVASHCTRDLGFTGENAKDEFIKHVKNGTIEDKLIEIFPDSRGIIHEQLQKA